MRNRQTLLIIVLLALFAPLSVKAQDEPSLALRVRRNLERKEPNWRYTAAIETARIPLVPSERTILTGGFYEKRKGLSHRGVGVYLYQVENSTEAARWLSPVRSGQTAPGWRVNKYDIGDEGYLADFQNGRQFEIHFRKGNIVVRVDGFNLSAVERFAKHILAQVSSV